MICSGRCWRLSEVTIQGDFCPFCRQMFNERPAKCDGDWHRMLDECQG
jgi:serine protein kinase